jgi:hypothetical protein
MQAELSRRYLEMLMARKVHGSQMLRKCLIQFLLCPQSTTRSVYGLKSNWPS